MEPQLNVKDQCISVLVPTPFCSMPEWTDDVLVECTRIAGGFTSYPFSGGWLDEKTGKIVADHGLRYDFHFESPKTWDEAHNMLRLVTAPARYLLGQGESCVAVLMLSEDKKIPSLILVDDDAIRLLQTAMTAVQNAFPDHASANE